MKVIVQRVGWGRKVHNYKDLSLNMSQYNIITRADFGMLNMHILNPRAAAKNY